MDFKEFLTKQEEVYNRFRDTCKMEAEGTKPNIPQKSQGGYLIAFRHSTEITQKVEDFSRRLAQTVPLIIYNTKTIHTTISDYGIKEDFVPDKDVLDKLCFFAGRYRVVDQPKISYKEWLYNQNTIIVAGMPNSIFLETAQKIYSLGEKKGVQLRMPWGAHITAGRFTEQTSPKELSDFFKLMKEAPVLGESRPAKIDVAYFNFSPEGFKVTVCERFSLN